MRGGMQSLGSVPIKGAEMRVCKKRKAKRAAIEWECRGR